MGLDLAAVRSLLFVPATRAERFAKAESAGADAVILDLEDAVPPAGKDAARTAALAHLTAPRPAPLVRCLRINSPRTPAGLRDLLALLDAPAAPDFLVLPKVDDAAELRLLDELLGSCPSRLLPLIESAAALAAAERIATHPRVAGVVFGGADLAADLGAAFAWEPLLFARSRVVQAAAAAGVPAFDVPYLDVADDAGLAAECTAVRGLGYAGKLAIHPKHVAGINSAFTPTPDAVASAERIVAADRAAAGGVCVVDGRMIDAPVVRAARRTLARARRPA